MQLQYKCIVTDVLEVVRLLIPERCQLTFNKKKKKEEQEEERLIQNVEF